MHIDTLNVCRVVVNLLITLYDFLHLYPFFFSSSVGHLHESLAYIYLKLFKIYGDYFIFLSYLLLRILSSS
jgi:hypothetical protein